jgi:hypothetical protein
MSHASQEGLALWPPLPSGLVATVAKAKDAEVTMRVLIAALALTVSAASAAKAGAMTEEQVASVQAAIGAAGCTVDEIDISTRGADISARGDRYEADGVECQDGSYDMALDKDFSIVTRAKVGQ